MEEISGYPMAQAIENIAIYSKLRELNFNDRCIRALDRIEAWKAIKYRNHQIYFLRTEYIQFTTRQPTIKELMNIFNISETPVRRAIKAGFQMPNDPGRHPALSIDAEKNLIEMIIEREAQGNPIVHVEFRKYVQENYKIAATTGWLQYFVQRYSDQIQKAKSYPQDDLRMTVPREFLTAHFTNMKELVEGCCSELCFNLDEVGSSDWEERKIRKVLISKSSDPKTVNHAVSRKYKHQTLVALVSSAGDALTPLLIASCNVEEDLNNNGYRIGDDVIFHYRNPPFINKELFNEYIVSVLIPYISSLREKEEYSQEPAVLLLDSCSAHIDDEILRILGENGIKAIAFPAHTTNIFQALDLVLFGIFKKKKETQKSTVDQNKQAFLSSKIINAYEETMTGSRIRSSFHRAGFTIDTSKNPHRLIFDENLLKDNPGFKELWDANIPIEMLSTRRRNHKFGWLNEQYLQIPGVQNASDDK